MDQGTQGYASRAFGEPGLGLVVPGGACDVEVDPGRIAGEFLDEHGAGDRAAAFAAADVLDVGDSALDEFAVVVVTGICHIFSPAALALARSLSVKAWSEPKTPTLILERATTMAPVSVAASTKCVAPSCLA